MAKSKKLDLVSIIICAVLLVATVLTIVGVCIAWIGVTSTSDITGTKYFTSTLSELLQSQSESVANGGSATEGLNANAAFAIMTVIFCGLTLIAYAVGKLLDVKVMKFVVLALAILTIVCAVVTLITGYTMTKDYEYSALLYGYNLSSAKTAPAAGTWLVFVFGILGGAAGAFGAIKK